MALATTSAVWRSTGGDTTRQAYAGSMVMAASFYFDPTKVNTTNIQKSATDTSAVILPAGAIITSIQLNAAGTGGTTPTIDMGFTVSGTNTPQGLLAAYAADGGKTTATFGTALTGTSLGAVMSATALATITGGATTGDAATGGTVSGRIFYFIADNGAQNV